MHDFSGATDTDLLTFIAASQSGVTLVESFIKRFGDEPVSDPDLKAERAAMYDEAEGIQQALTAARLEALNRGLTEPPHHLDPKEPS